MKVEVERKQSILNVTFKRIEHDRFEATAEVDGVSISKEQSWPYWLGVGDKLIIHIPVKGADIDGTTSRSS